MATATTQRRPGSVDTACVSASVSDAETPAVGDGTLVHDSVDPWVPGVLPVPVPGDALLQLHQVLRRRDTPVHRVAELTPAPVGDLPTGVDPTSGRVQQLLAGVGVRAVRSILPEHAPLLRLTVIGVCLSSSLIAYGFSRLRWPGRDVLSYLMVATLLLPFIATLIPLFVLYKDIGWVGSQTVDHPDVLRELRGECRKEEHVAETDHGEHQSADSQTEADASHDAPPVAK